MTTNPATHGASTPNAPLFERYAQALGISPAAAPRRLFYECVSPWRRGFVCLHRWFRPRLYASDQRLVQEAGLAHSRQEVMNAIDGWQHRESSTRAWERDLFGWRVSSRRLMAVARTVFGARGQADHVVTPAPTPADGADWQRLRFELDVHQIEPGLQNEELRAARADLRSVLHDQAGGRRHRPGAVGGAWHHEEP